MPYINPKYSKYLIKIGLSVSYYRKKEKNITQQELADMTGLSRGTISSIEAPDHYYSMSLNSLFTIAEALKIPVKSFWILEMMNKKPVFNWTHLFEGKVL